MTDARARAATTASDAGEPTAAVGSISTLTGTIKLKLRTPSKMRNLELFLLLIAFAIGAAAMVLVQVAVLDGELDAGPLTLLAGLGVLVLIGHLALRVTAPDADPFLLPVATALNGLGIAEIYRIDLHYGYGGWDAAGVRQIAWTAIALVVAFGVLLLIRNHRVLLRYRYVAMFTGIVLLLLPMLPGIGEEAFGARLWIRIGIFSFQPGELAKIALAIFFAGYLMQHRESLSLVGTKFLGMRFPRVRDFGPILVIWAAAMGVLVFQRDLGTALLYFGLFIVMLYVATGRLSWVIIGLGLFGVGAYTAAQLFPHVAARFNGWINAFDQEVYDAFGGSGQLVQGLFGLAQGGLIGTGLGQGRPYLTPIAQSDFIIASLGEELGLAGLFAIFALYLLLVARGIRIGSHGTDDFGRLLSVGLSFVIALQVFIVVGGVTRLIPITGLTTPFLAAGGSSLVANWIIVVLLLRLSDTLRTNPMVNA